VKPNAQKSYLKVEEKERKTTPPFQYLERSSHTFRS